MSRLALVSVIVLAAACSKQAAAPPPAAPQACAKAPRVATAEELQAVAQEACACTDDACTAKAHEKLAAMVVKIEDLAALEGLDCQRGGEGALVELRSIHQAACACADTDCVAGIQRDLATWADTY